MPIPLLALGAGALLLMKGKKSFGIGKITSAFKANNIPEGILKGMGSAIIVNRLNAALGDPLSKVGLSFSIPGTGVNITPFTFANYFLLNGLKPSINKNAAAGALAAVFAGVNPSGSIGAASTIRGTGRGGGGAAYQGL